MGATALGMALATTLATTTAAHATPVFRQIAHTKPAWTLHARHVGAAHANAAVQVRVYLAPRGGIGALRNFALSVSTPGNAQYRHFLTAAQYRQRFGTPDATVGAVRSYLHSAGMRVTRVAPGNHYVVASGTVRAANKAFGADLARYRHHGQVVRAPSNSVRLPARLASSVLTVTGLDTTPHIAKPASHQAAPPPPGFRNARPCSSYYGQIKADTLPTFEGHTLPYTVCGYTGRQFRAAYEGNSSLDGSGQTVAITDAYAAPTIVKDAHTYAAKHGDGAYAPGQFTQHKPSSLTHVKLCGPQGWYGEETLDVESVHAMAPGANIEYYGASSCLDPDLLDTLQQVVDDDTAQLVTNSWGDVEATATADSVAAYEQVFLQGAAEGISFMFSSGDNGDERVSSGVKQADYPASDPYVTAVGGTSDAIGADGRFEWQTGWGTHKYSLNATGTAWTNNAWLYGAGGGSSALFKRPAYQDGFTRNAYRQVPDVGLDADPNTGMLVGETQTFPNGAYYDEYRLGGTSLASPLFAGMTALTLQNGGGAGLGLLNPTIYGNASHAFTDVSGPGADPGNVRVDFANSVDASKGLVYSVRTFDQDSSLQVTPGYDDVTGVGSPNPSWLKAAPAS